MISIKYRMSHSLALLALVCAAAPEVLVAHSIAGNVLLKHYFALNIYVYENVLLTSSSRISSSLLMLARCMPWNLQYCSALYQLACKDDKIEFLEIKFRESEIASSP